MICEKLHIPTHLELPREHATAYVRTYVTAERSALQGSILGHRALNWRVSEVCETPWQVYAFRWTTLASDVAYLTDYHSSTSPFITVDLVSLTISNQNSKLWKSNFSTATTTAVYHGDNVFHSWRPLSSLLMLLIPLTTLAQSLMTPLVSLIALISSLIAFLTSLKRLTVTDNFPTSLPPTLPQ